MEVSGLEPDSEVIAAPEITGTAEIEAVEFEAVEDTSVIGDEAGFPEVTGEPEAIAEPVAEAVKPIVEVTEPEAGLEASDLGLFG